ncbi:MAG: cysteine hydrolase family protein [Chloroflexota bacterium]
MSLTVPAGATLLVIDVQQGLDLPFYGERNNPDAEANIGKLITAWRAAGWPLIHIQHHSTNPDSPLHPTKPTVAFKPEAEPYSGEPVIAKGVNSAFIGTDLEQRLRDANAEHLVICGLTAEHCVSTTTRMAGNFGFSVTLAGDATFSHSKTTFTGETVSAEQVHTVALANLHNEFARVVTTEDVIAALGEVR